MNHTDDLMRALGRIEAKLDTVIDTQDDHKKRLTSLERWRSVVIGGASVIGAAFTFFTTK